jgi:hypothetical protein
MLERSQLKTFLYQRAECLAKSQGSIEMWIVTDSIPSALLGSGRGQSGCGEECPSASESGRWASREK